MKLIPYFIKIYKDIVFCTIVILWLICNLLEAYYTGEVFLVNMFGIMFMSLLVIIKKSCKKFNDWLNTPLDKNERYKYRRKIS